jgi:hypothetical protein
MKTNFKTDICANCGASLGLHQFETYQCPRNGMEQTWKKPQQWQNTFFEDSGIRHLHDAAPDLLEVLIDVLAHCGEPGFICQSKNIDIAIQKAKQVIKKATK